MTLCFDICCIVQSIVGSVLACVMNVQVELITQQAMRAGFTGGLVVDYPNSSKAKKLVRKRVCVCGCVSECVGVGVCVNLFLCVRVCSCVSMYEKCVCVVGGGGGGGVHALVCENGCVCMTMFLCVSDNIPVLGTGCSLSVFVV